MEEERSYSIGRAPTLSRHNFFVDLNSNSLLPPVMETRDDVNIHNFDLFIAVLGIEHTPCLYFSLQVNIKVPSSTMKLMDNF